MITSTKGTRPPELEKQIRPDYLVFGRPDIHETDIAAVVETLRSGWIGSGPRVARFEQSFKEYLTCEHALAVSSCTAALHLAMVAVGLKPGDEVIVPSMTFAATANAVIHASGIPVLADVDRQTQCLTAETVAPLITEKTRALIPVHFAGRSCEMDELLELARQNNLLIIEDCAHAIETLYRGRHVGTFGDLGAFSFYVTKNVVTGEGGMVTTGSGDYAKRIKLLALHGLSQDAWKRFSDDGFKHYEVEEPGFKYNMMDLQAALGILQLSRVEENLQRREAIWQRYDEAFAKLPIYLPIQPEPWSRHARHLYTLMLDVDRLRLGRDEIQAVLHEQNIGTGVHYRAVHLHRYYRETFGYRRGDFPNAEWISDRTISLPLSTALSDRDVQDVIDVVTRTLECFLR